VNCDACAQVNYVDVNGMRFSVGVSLSVREEGVAGGNGQKAWREKGGQMANTHACM